MPAWPEKTHSTSSPELTITPRSGGADICHYRISFNVPPPSSRLAEQRWMEGAEKWVTRSPVHYLKLRAGREAFWGSLQPGGG